MNEERCPICRSAVRRTDVECRRCGHLLNVRMLHPDAVRSAMGRFRRTSRPSRDAASAPRPPAAA